MAFPTIADTVISQQAVDTTSHPVDLPTVGIGSVALVVAFISGSNTPLTGLPLGWRTIVNLINNSPIQVFTYHYRPALLPVLGVERGERTLPGDTLPLVTAVARKSTVVAMVFAEEFPDSYVLASSNQTGGLTAPNSPNLVYSASAKDVLWFSVVHPTGTWEWTSVPPNYTHFFDDDFPPTVGAIATRELNAASEDPGDWEPWGPSDHSNATIGVALDGP